MGIGELTFGEEVGQDADDIMTVLRLVAVDTGVQLVPAPGYLGEDKAAPVGVDERRVGTSTSAIPASCWFQKFRMCSKC